MADINKIYNIPVVAQKIKRTEAYSGIDKLAQVIQICRLKSYHETTQKYIFDTEAKRADGNWVDEFGNLLQVKDKQINIIFGSLAVPRNNILHTDLYRGLTLPKIAKISKSIFLMAGKDDTSHQDCLMLCFWGIDNFLRNYLYLNGEWKNISPLFLGFDNLRTFCSYSTNQNYYGEMTGTTDFNFFPCVGSRAWLSSVSPAPFSFQQMINQQSYHQHLEFLFR